MAFNSFFNESGYMGILIWLKFVSNGPISLMVLSIIADGIPWNMAPLLLLNQWFPICVIVLNNIRHTSAAQCEMLSFRNCNSKITRFTTVVHVFNNNYTRIYVKTSPGPNVTGSKRPRLGQNVPGYQVKTSTGNHVHTGRLRPCCLTGVIVH